MKKILEFIGCVLIDVFFLIYTALIMNVLWDWLIVTQFNIISLNVSQCAAVLLIANFVIHRIPKAEDLNYEIVERCTIRVIVPLVYLLLGYILTFVV